ncbi:Protein of unknown function [Gryllus bimaculatus]|nr:Protein of unknown function [Gryllus bimaculatus]
MVLEWRCCWSEILFLLSWLLVCETAVRCWLHAPVAATRCRPPLACCLPCLPWRAHVLVSASWVNCCARARRSPFRGRRPCKRARRRRRRLRVAEGGRGGRKVLRQAARLRTVPQEIRAGLQPASAHEDARGWWRFSEESSGEGAGEGRRLLTL